MLKELLSKYNIVLASASPRRQQIFKELGLDFEIRKQSVPEKYPKHLKGKEIPIFLAELKASELTKNLGPDELLITSDTIVWYEGKTLGKPRNNMDAHNMLRDLSGNWHEVITAVCFTTKQKRCTIHDSTSVKFKELSEMELNYYIENYQPYDKAGAYGIQDWLGHIAIEEIRGSYTNVMGLPTHLVYKTLMAMVC